MSYTLPSSISSSGVADLPNPESLSIRFKNLTHAQYIIETWPIVSLCRLEIFSPFDKPFVHSISTIMQSGCHLSRLWKEFTMDKYMASTLMFSLRSSSQEKSRFPALIQA